MIRPLRLFGALGGNCSALLGAVLGALLILMHCGALSAQTFTWTNSTGGEWGTGANWLSGTFPNASGTTADFSTLTIQAPGVISLGASFTVGNMIFGDSAKRNGWTLASDVATDTLTLKVASGSPTVTVSNQYAFITAILAGNQGLTVAGSGNLVLEPANDGLNKYTGITAIDSGAVLDAIDSFGLPTENNLQLAGGIFESNGTFTRTLGVNTQQVQWTASGGFSAEGGEFDIRLDNSTNTVTWNAGGLPATNTPMLFNDLTSDSLLNFENGINLANAAQTFNVTHNPNSTTDLAEISGVLTNGGVTLTGSGVLWLNAANTYIKPTLILGGILRGTDGSSLPTASNLTLNGGVFESNGVFTRTLGVAAGDVQWTGSGGFSAQGGEFDIRLNNSVNTVTWGSGSFVPTGKQLILNAYSADSLLNFENPINLAAALQTIDVVDNPNSTNDLAEMSGILSNGGLIVNGSGVLLLTATNTYTLATQLTGGTLRAIDGTGLPTKSNLTFNGGVFESHGTFIRALGTGVGQVQWTGAGGFSAQGGEFDIKLGNSTAVVTFDSGSFVPTGDTLILNASTADSLLNFENAINLDDGYQTVASFDNPNSTTDLAEISGIMTNGGLVKEGTGTLWLTGKNTYALSTFIEAGTLRAIDGTGLPSGSDLVLDGGMFESNGTFKRTIGTTGGEVDWGSSGGFSAQGGTLNIQLNGGTATVTWGSANFLQSGEPLQLNALTSDSVVNFQNGIDLAGTNQTVTVIDNPNSSTDLAQISGVITDGGLTKNGDGTLWLSVKNTYTQPTIIEDGALRAIDGTGLPAASNLVLNGGVFESFGTFTRALGTGTANNQVQWQGSGGFSAQGGQFLIKLGNGTATVTWGTNHFVPTGSSLLFNSPTSDNLVNFENGINLDGSLQTVSVTDNTFLTTDLAQISGVISNGGLIKAGAGTLILSATNTYAGGTQISAGTLEITIDTALGAVPSGLTTTSSIDFTGGGATTSTGATVETGTLQFATTFSGTISGNRIIEVFPGVTATIDTNGKTITGAGQLVLDDAVAGVGSATLIKADSTGTGIFETDIAPYLGDGSAVQVNNGTLRFKVTSIPNTAKVGAGVTATVASGATLELAGTASSLGILAGNRTNVVNNSQVATTGGLYVSGTNQVLGSITGTGNTVVGSATVAGSLTAYQIVQNSLTISSGSTVTLTPSGSGSTTNPTGPNNVNYSSTLTSLTIAGTTNAWTGTLDIGNNGLVIAYGTAANDPYVTINNMIKTGFDAAHWDGTGITSSLGRAAANSATPLNIGLVDFTPGKGNFTGATFIVFAGQTVTTNAILIRLTYMDDIVLAGDMSVQHAASDALIFAANYGTGTTWSVGDLEHTGSVSSADALLFAANYATGLPSLDGTTGNAVALGNDLAAVPEPASAALAATGAIGLGFVVRSRRRAPVL